MNNEYTAILRIIETSCNNCYISRSELDFVNSIHDEDDMTHRT